MFGRLSGILVAGMLGFMPVSADAITTFDISGTVADGAFSGAVGSGSVSFNEALLTGVTGEFLNPGNDADFALSFSLFGQLFSAFDDIDFDDFPLLTFDENGNPTDIDFVVDEASLTNPTDIVQAGVASFDLFGLSQDPFSSGLITGISVNGGISAVPLPATLPLFLGGLLAGGFLLRRRTATV